MITTRPGDGVDADGFDPLAATRDERLELCDVLATLSPQEWATPSLCDGWNVREVAAHLTTSTRTG